MSMTRTQNTLRQLGNVALVAGLAVAAISLGGCSYSCVDEYRTIRNIEIAPSSGDGSSLVSMIQLPVDQHQTAMAEASGPTRSDMVDRQ